MTPTFSVIFNLDSDTSTFGKFVLTADDVYTQSGIALSDVIGYYTISFPNGSGYVGNFATPDFNGGTSLVFDTLNIPKDSFGDFMKGNFLFQLNVSITGVGDYSSAVVGFDTSDSFCAIPKGLDINIVSDCFCRKLTANNATKYSLFSVTSQVLTLTPPANTGQSSYTVAGSSLTYSFTHTGIYQVSGNVALTYSLGIFTVITRVKTATGQSVKCDYDLCALSKCIESYYTNIQKMSAKYGSLNAYLQQGSLAWENYQLLPQYILRHDNALKCGQFGVADALYEKIKELLNCDCGCDDCDDDTPRLVNPYCGGGGGSNPLIYNVEGISPIQVSSNTVGDTTTFTISLLSGFQTQVTTLQSEVTALQASVTALQGSVTTIENNVTNILSQVPVLLYGDGDGEGTDDLSATQALMDDYTLLGDTLFVNGDVIKIEATVASFGSKDKDIEVSVRLGGVKLASFLKVGFGLIHFDINIIRQDQNNQYVYSIGHNGGSFTFGGSSVSQFQLTDSYTKALDTTIDLGLNNVIDILVEKGTGNFIANEVIARSLTVKHFKK